jgi:hypothetical protein
MDKDPVASMRPSRIDRGRRELWTRIQSRACGHRADVPWDSSHPRQSYARIHESNLVNFGIPPLRFIDPEDAHLIQQGDRLAITGLRKALESGHTLFVKNITRKQAYPLHHGLSPRQVTMLLAGGLTRFLQHKWQGTYRKSG